MVASQVQRGIAKQARNLALGRDEVSRASAVQDVLVGGEFALAGIARQQGFGRLATQHQIKLPGQVVGILHARVGAARAKRRHAVRRVACKVDPAQLEAGHALAGEGVDAGPFESEWHFPAQGLPHHRVDPRLDALGLFLLVGIGVPAELKVDAPHPIRLAVQQHALVAMKRRVEPEPALGREVHLHAHVSDQEAVAKHPARALLPHQLAQRRTCAVAGGEVIGAQRVAALGGGYAQQHTADIATLALRGLRQRGDGVLPANLDVGQGQRSQRQVSLGVVLLQVDEGRALVAGLGQQVKRVEQAVAEEHPAAAPLHALGAGRVAHPQPVPDLQGALGKTDGPRPGGQAVVVVEQQHALAALGQVNRQTQTHRAGTHHHHSVACGRSRVLVGRADVGKGMRLNRRAVAIHRQAWAGSGSHGVAPCFDRWCAKSRLSLPVFPTSADRALPSRCAGRGIAWPRHRRGSRQTACSGRRSPNCRTAA